MLRDARSLALAERRERISRVILSAARATGSSPESIRWGRCRRGADIEPRQFALWLVHQTTGLGRPTIGRFFQLDANTVLNAIRRVERELGQDRGPWLEYLRRAA